MITSPNKARRAKEKEMLRNKILTVTKAIAAKEGWENVSIRKIAFKIQYSLPVIYSHFKDKDEIISIIADEEYAIFEQSGLSMCQYLVQNPSKFQILSFNANKFINKLCTK
jgi:AcrR family transcriptional regulator